jgi:hypothetical protein
LYFLHAPEEIDVHANNVDDEIEKLGPEVSKVYFEAKEALSTSHDSRSEPFSTAARIVRAFWKKVRSSDLTPHSD